LKVFVIDGGHPETGNTTERLGKLTECQEILVQLMESEQHDTNDGI
jgi:hypothetical protein